MTNSNLRLAILAGVFLVVTIAVSIFWLGGRGYGKVDRQTYEIAKATYGVCLAKDKTRLKRVEELLENEETIRDIPPHELRWLEQMIAKARNGKWTSAAKLARRMMEDQVE